jgi:hypothetical protein
VNILQKTVAAVALTLATGAQAALMSDSVPGVGTLRNDKANGAGFSSVKVTGFSGRAGESDGYFYPGAFAADSYFRFFCIEIVQTATTSAQYDASLWAHEDIQRLFDTAFPNKHLLNFYDGGITDFGAFSTADAGAAFQLAVWELVFDPGNRDLSAGTFHVTAGSSAAITALAQGWLDALDASTTWDRWSLYRFTNASKQDYVSATFRVPEPSTLALLAAGFAWVIVTRRRRPKS